MNDSYSESLKNFELNVKKVTFQGNLNASNCEMLLPCTKDLKLDIQTIDSNQRVSNKHAIRKDRDRRYRDKHQEKINQRRRENRLNHQRLQSIPSSSDIDSIQLVRHNEASSKRVDKETLRRERDRKYRERHREEINRRRKERRRKQIIQRTVATSNIPSIDKTQENVKEISDQQPTMDHSLVIDISQSFSSGSEHNRQYSKEEQNIIFLDTSERQGSDQHRKETSDRQMNGTQKSYTYNDLQDETHNYFKINFSNDRFEHALDCDRLRSQKDLIKSPIPHENVINGITVEDNITDPSRPMKRRIDELLLRCRTKMREKDHQITVLKEQVEELTEKNIRLRNALIDLTNRSTVENAGLDITKETATWIEQEISVQIKGEVDVKVEGECEFEVGEDTKPLIEQYDIEYRPMNDDITLIKTEIEIHEHDINDATNVTSVTEGKSNVDILQIKKEIEIGEERRDDDIGEAGTVEPDRGPCNTNVSTLTKNIATYTQCQYEPFWEVSKQENIS